MKSKNGKVWGETECLFFKNNVEIHRIEIKKGAKCSKHKHDHKYNGFYIESGKLKIISYKNDYDLVDETIIKKGESTVSPPMEYHQFECIEDCVAYEIYWVELSQNDITRENVGSK